MSNDDLLAWIGSEGDAVDVVLGQLADRRSALTELERSALKVASTDRTVTVTPERLLAAHASDPAAAAAMRSLLLRAVAPTTDDKKEY